MSKSFINPSLKCALEALKPDAKWWESENEEQNDQIFRSGIGDRLREVLERVIKLPCIGGEIWDLLGQPRFPWPKGLSKNEMRGLQNSL